MGLKDRLHRIERNLGGETITIPQKNGGIARFPREALEEAFLRNMDFLHARADGEEPPDPHPLQLALQNARHREPRHDTFIDLIEDTGPVEDLSE